MRNLLIVLLAVIIVVAGAFLPGFLMERSSGPEIELNYQQVNVDSADSSDYAWRLRQIAEFHFGDAETLLNTYISQPENDAEYQELEARFFGELEELSTRGVINPDVCRMVQDADNAAANYHFVFNTEDVKGFRAADLIVNGRDWEIQLTMDVESGKLAKISFVGEYWQNQDHFLPAGWGSWYDVLRAYGDYLGLSAVGLNVPPEEAPAGEATVRTYYENITADRLAANLASGGGNWLEVRAMRDRYYAGLCVYRGGK